MRYIASLGPSQAKADKLGFIRSARVAPYRSEYLHGALESRQGLGPKPALIWIAVAPQAGFKGRQPDENS
jgi:hypothetical protein